MKIFGGHGLDGSSMKFSVEEAQWKAGRYSCCVQGRLHDCTSIGDNIYPIYPTEQHRTVQTLLCISLVSRVMSVYYL